ncbi:MAG: class I SAM-dependent methyltransferase [Acidobacteriota bacterium]|nr:class I SAM-dependent methyltransferase [Acidobacteriota bacterium]
MWLTDARSAHEANRRSWNQATEAHNSHKADQAAFLRGGGSTLFPEEVKLLGELEGQSLLHLLCNCGQDTLSLANHGALVTGVDISDEAVAFARRLSEDSGVPGRFQRSDVFDFLPAARERGETYQRIFLSYGALPWVSDLQAFFRGAAELLAPGGRLALVEFHPMVFAFDEARTLQYSYFGDGRWMVEAAGVPDYVAESGEGLAPSGQQQGVQDFTNPHPTYEFQWSVGQVLTAILEAGLTLKVVQELPYSNGWKMFENMLDVGNRRFALPPEEPQLPLLLSVLAVKPQGRSAEHS